MSEMSEYWKDVSPILKEQATERRENNFDKRLQYAIEQFESNKISYKLCNKNIGHFNLYHKEKVVMSFWSYTGRIYSSLLDINEDNQRGIKQCIKIFKKNFEEEI